MRIDNETSAREWLISWGDKMTMSRVDYALQGLEACLKHDQQRGHKEAANNVTAAIRVLERWQTTGPSRNL